MQANVYVEVAVMLERDWLPLVGCVPVHDPLAVQLFAFVELQVRVALPPEVTDETLGLNESVGAGVVVPPPPPPEEVVPPPPPPPLGGV